jgi:phosphatidylethanolamine/phosphatidyl-N-methylethanolamine N-methyltransferase
MNIERSSFLREYLRHPLRTAAILPTSPRVARQMAGAVPDHGDPVVVELGPGTGAFTGEIQRRLGGRGHHLAVELNGRFADDLRPRFPHVDVAVGDAVNLRRILDDRGLDHADLIISGLPHALFPATLQRRLMEAFRHSLAPHGRLVAHAYVHAAWWPPARHFRRLLDAGFGEVAVGKVHWTNIPPVFVYIAGRMRRTALQSSRSTAAAADRMHRLTAG